MQPIHTQESPVLIRGARIFDTSNATLVDGCDVLVEGGRITRVGRDIDAPNGTRRIDAAGRVLTPGFIDSHAHIMFQMSYGEGLSSDEFHWAYVATRSAETYLMNGYTTVRDVGGNCFSLKKNIDNGRLVGPRIYPSGPLISQTSGHADHRLDCHKCALIANERTVFQKYHMTSVVDGRDEMLKAAREALRRGASQIKICTGGGTGSYADPLDVVQCLPDEVRAAVEAAADWGTYVCTHAYTDQAARRAIDNGVRTIEHGNLLTEDTLRVMIEQDVWLSPQIIVYTQHPLGYTADQKAKHDQALTGVENLFAAVKRLGLRKVAFGSDIITDPALLARINEEFVLRSRWFSPAEVLQQATRNSAEMLALSGPRNPYPGKLGVIEEGAHADLLLIDGDPLVDLTILTRPQETLAMIMKAGAIFKLQL